jgi:hypothetical protein
MQLNYFKETSMDVISSKIVTNQDGTITLTTVLSPDTVPVPTPVPVPPPSAIPNPLLLTLGDTYYRRYILGAGSKAYFEIDIPALSFLRFQLSSYDQQAIINMVVQNGDQYDFFDKMEAFIRAQGLWSTPYMNVYEGIAVWANMNNNVFGQQVVITSPAMKKYYAIVKNEDLSKVATFNLQATGG